MKTVPALSFLARLTDKIRPSDLLHSEHRSTVRLHIESFLTETGFDRLQFGRHIRTEINELREWLSEAKELSVDALTEICGMFHISIGELVAE